MSEMLMPPIFSYYKAERCVSVGQSCYLCVMSIVFSDTLRQVFARMNDLGQQAKAFFFALDYEGQEAILYDADQLAEGVELYFNLGAKSYAPNPQTLEQRPTLTSLMPEPLEQYLRRFALVHEALKRGDSFLSNLTIRTPITLEGNLLQVYLHAQARYKVYVPGRFVCFSPEGFVHIDANGRIYTYPMKGTQHHSQGSEQADHLQHNDKEMREHSTIVDLMRNDLSISAEGVHVPRLRYAERLRTSRGEITQTSSEIVGQLPKGWQGKLGDILASLLPAGSISGAPKRRTVEVIQEAEGRPRGFYTGVAGYYDGSSLESAVLIRYIEEEEGRHFYRSGGGITALSKGADEWQECIDKIYLPWAQDTADAIELIETIRVQRGGICLLPLHLERMRNSLEALGQTDSPMMRLLTSGRLSQELEHYVQTHHSLYDSPTLKLRLTYTHRGVQTCTLSPYNLRTVERLRLWEVSEDLDYSIKRSDRASLELAVQQAGAEVILVRGGEISDTSYSNLVVHLGGELLTPERPLLRGVMREHLLRSGRIRTARLRPADLQQATEIHLINAMMPLDGPHITLPPSAITH